MPEPLLPQIPLALRPTSTEQRLRRLEERLAGLLRDDGQLLLSASQRLELRVGEHQVLIDASGVSVRSPDRVRVEAPQVELAGQLLRVDQAMVKASGVVQCETLITQSVVANSYTPGAGNIS